MRELVARFDEAVVERQYEPLEFIEVGTAVVIPLRWTAHGRVSGAGFIELFQARVFAVDEGLIRTIVEYGTMEQALEALGGRG
jgi:hypothetical protein